MSAQNADNPSQLKKSKLIMSPISESLRLKLSDLGYTNFFTENNEPSAKDAIMQNDIHPSAIIYPGVTIGKGVHIGAYAVVGSAPEHKKYWKDKYKSVVIGDDCWIGNHVTIDSGTEQDTLIGNKVIILRHAHLGHDCIIDDNCEVSAGVLLGGHTVMKYASVAGLGSIVRQHLSIGRMSMLGAGAMLTKDIPDGEIWIGNPAKFMKKNIRRIELYGNT